MELHWHAYRLHHVTDTCLPFAEYSKPISPQLVNDLNLWQPKQFIDDRNTSEVVFGFESALQFIHDHQYIPSEKCKSLAVETKPKYLVSNGWPFGFGSRIHQEGVALAIALQLGRIYIPHSLGKNIHWETNTSFCQVRSLECYYHNYTNCYPSKEVIRKTNQANDQIHVGVGRIPKNVKNIISFHDVHLIFDNEFELKRIKDKYKDEDILYLHMHYLGKNRGVDVKKFIPSFLQHAILKCSPMRTNNHFYWWRAISSAFLVRPNDFVKNSLLQFRDLTIKELPRSCIAIHVRHGDKVKEMTLVPLEKYLASVEYIWNNHNPSLHHLVLSSDDYQAYVDTSLFCQQNNCTVSYLNLTNFEFDKGLWRTSSSDRKHDNDKDYNDGGYLSMLFNLQLSLQCQAFVCSIASNTCRLIDELRATISSNANGMYIDLSEESCSHPPCINHPDRFID